MKKDRLITGAIAGLIGSAAQNIYGQIAKGLGITDRAFLDFAEIALFGKVFGGIIGFVTGTLAHLVFGILVGVLFAYILRMTSSNYLYLKGLGFGVAIWFLTLAVGTLFDLPKFNIIPPVSGLVIFIGALLWGVVTAYSIKILEQRTDLI